LLLAVGADVGGVGLVCGDGANCGVGVGVGVKPGVRGICSGVGVGVCAFNETKETNRNAKVKATATFRVETQSGLSILNFTFLNYLGFACYALV